jgi:hypothetical protein
MTIIDAIKDKRLFGGLPIFSDLSTWANWLVCLKAIFALEMTRAESEIYQKFTGRMDHPTEPFKEVFLLIGRRGGKSLMAALVSVWLAVFVDWKLGLERGYIMAIATDRRQAGVVFNYIRRILQLPAFKGMIVNENKEEIELSNNLVISVQTCSYRSLRGFQVCAAVCDEIGFWYVEGANPAQEILTGLRPSLGNLPGSKLLCISSGFQKSGPLWEAFRSKFGENDPDTLVWRSATLEMNPLYNERVIVRALEEDYLSARAEYFGEFRADLETYISSEAIEACIVPGRFELLPVASINYVGFVDPSGGRGDSMTLSIAHREGDKIIQDCVRVKHPPFNPQDCVKEYAAVLKTYGLSRVTGDRYSGAWCSSEFEKVGITYTNADLSKSNYYLEFLPIVMQGGCELLDHKQQASELRQLLRRTGKGKDTVDHPPNLHDDAANACAAACVLAKNDEWPISRILIEVNKPIEIRTEEDDLEAFEKELLLDGGQGAIEHRRDDQIEIEEMRREIEAEEGEEKRTGAIITRGWSR